MIAAFPAPAWQRLLVALLYATGVAAAVWAVERGTAASAAPETAARVAAAGIALHVESTFPVARWIVLVDGQEIMGQGAERSWSGMVSGREVLVQAERVDAADLAPGALRLMAGARSTLAWGEGTVSVTMRLP